MEEVENPFVIGKVVTGSRFADREKEIELISTEVKNKQNVILISPRRYGKTSLVINVLEKRGLDYVYVDCSLADDEASLVEQLLNNYVGKKPFERIAAEVRKFTRDLEVTLEVNPMQIKVRKVGETGLAEVIKYISSRVVVFDEFQEVVNISKKLPNEIRSAVQQQNNSFIFLGSKRHMMEEMFESPNNPFYNSGVIVKLEKIPVQEFKKFILQWFEKTHVLVDEKDVSDVLEFSSGHPFYTQYACHFLWEKRRQGNKKSFQDILREIVEANSASYESFYSGLTANQKRALNVVANEKNMFSQKAIEKYKLKNTQNLQKALKSLAKKEFIDKNGGYYFLDLFFKKWVKYLTLEQKSVKGIDHKQFIL